MFSNKIFWNRNVLTWWKYLGKNYLRTTSSIAWKICCAQWQIAQSSGPEKIFQKYPVLLLRPGTRKSWEGPKWDSLSRDRNGTVTEPKEKGPKDIPVCSFILLMFPLERQKKSSLRQNAPTKSNCLASRELHTALATAPADLSSCRQPKREKTSCQS